MSDKIIERAQLGRRNQMVLPAGVRKVLCIGEGDEVLIRMVGKTAVIIPKPKSYANRLCGLHSEIWRDVDLDQYIKEERDSWGT